MYSDFVASTKSIASDFCTERFERMKVEAISENNYGFSGAYEDLAFIKFHVRILSGL